MRDDSTRFPTIAPSPRPARARRSLPLFFAYCEIRRAARRWTRRLPDDPVFIVLVVPPGGHPETYAMAARLVFDPPVAFSDGEGSCVSVIAEARGARDWNRETDSWPLANRSRTVLVTDGLTDLPTAARLSADQVMRLEPPTASHLLAASKLFPAMSMTRAEAERLEDERVDTLVAALRPGRSAAAAIQAIEAVLAVPPCTATGPTLADLPGLGAAAKWGHQLAADIAGWRTGLLRWKDIDRGALVSGPPGTGKTTFAKALARTAGLRLVVGSLARWQATGRLGDCLAAMREAFEEARDNPPALLFIDEIDAVGDRNTFAGDNAQYHTEVVAALLECLDGAESREGVVVIGATNRPDALDAALLRPGRLDRHLSLPLPGGNEREAILRFHLDGDLVNAPLTWIASRTKGWSGAGLERLVRDARRLARREGRAIAIDDLVACMPIRIALADDDVWRTAVHEAGHAVVAECVRPGSVTGAFVAREWPSEGEGTCGGGTAQAPHGVGHATARDFMDGVAILLAGGCAEQLLLGERSTASGGHATSDLHEATLNLLRLELCYGLGAELAFSHACDEERDLLAALRSDAGLRERVERALREQSERAEELVRLKRAGVEAVARALVESGELDGQTINSLTHLASISPQVASRTQKRRATLR